MYYNLLTERVQGEDHADTALCLANLGLLLQNQGKYSEAEPLYQRALHIREARLGEGHPTTKIIRKNLDLLKQKMEDAAQDNQVDEQPKPSRNAPCHCGSGKRYKQCHGRLAVSA